MPVEYVYKGQVLRGRDIVDLSTCAYVPPEIVAQALIDDPPNWNTPAPEEKTVTPQIQMEVEAGHLSVEFRDGEVQLYVWNQQSGGTDALMPLTRQETAALAAGLYQKLEETK